MANKRVFSIIYLEKNGFYFYANNLSTILRLGFPQDTVNYFEVINEDKLDAQIKTFVETSKLTPSPAVLILGNSLFIEKTFPNTEEKKSDSKTSETKPSQQTLIDEFLESVPFEDVASKTFPATGGVKVITTNEDLFLSVKSSFEKCGYDIDAVSPIAIFGKAINPANGLSAEGAQLITQRLNAIKQNNLLIKPATTVSNQEETEAEQTNKPEGKPSKKRMVILVLIFAVLLVIMGVLLYMNVFSQQQPVKQNSGTLKNGASKTLVLTTPTQQVSKDSLRIHLNNEKSSTSSAELQKLLRQNGYANIQISVESNTIPKTLVVFKPTVPQQFQDEILNQVKIVSPVFSSQQSDVATSDATITLGK